MKRKLKRIPKSLSEFDLINAREIFQRHESRDLFYRAARELVRLAIAGQTEITLAEALGTLLQTWNKSFYRFHGQFDEAHIRALENLIHESTEQLDHWRERAISSMCAEENTAVSELYASFEMILGPVGAAKALHLLASQFFPLWDRAIANHYGIRLKRIGQNSDNYLRFMDISRQQVLAVSLSSVRADEVLKMIDEYNYCLITKGWT